MKRIFNIIKKFNRNKIIRNYFKNNKVTKLHIGCGSNILEGWLNADLESGDIILDARRKLLLKDNSFDFIFNEHFLEHLEYPKEALFFLKECNRILKNNGVIRIGVPDTKYCLNAYVNNNSLYFKLAKEKWHPKELTTKMEHINYHFRHDGQHKFSYDYETIKKILKLARFNKVIRSSYNKSKFLELRIDKWDIPGTLYIEAIKLVRN